MLCKMLPLAKLQVLTTAGQCLFKENKHDKSEKSQRCLCWKTLIIGISLLHVNPRRDGLGGGKYFTLTQGRYVAFCCLVFVSHIKSEPSQVNQLRKHLRFI